MDAERAVDGGADGARRKDIAAERRCEAASAAEVPASSSPSLASEQSTIGIFGVDVHSRHVPNVDLPNL